MGALILRAFAGLIGLFAVMAILLFATAWSLAWPQAWVFLAAFFGSSLLITLYLIRADPALLERRVNGGPAAETQPKQQLISACASLGFIGLLVIPALDHRLGWSHLPLALTSVGDGGVVLGFLMVAMVFRENSFTSATISVGDDQTVISTGPYSLVRHPMYTGALLLTAATAVALGSWWGLVGFAVLAPAVVWRLFDEEAFLSQNLAGYRAYTQTVRRRLIPYVW
jgi:protein-S-isoprenylcysteine O-methyltransferase Ste14